MVEQNIKTNYKTPQEKAKGEAIVKRHEERRELNQKLKRQQSHPTVNKVIKTAKKVAAWAISNNTKWKKEHTGKTKTKARPSQSSSKRQSSSNSGSEFGDPFGNIPFNDPGFDDPFSGNDYSKRFRPPF